MEEDEWIPAQYRERRCTVSQAALRAVSPPPPAGPPRSPPLPPPPAPPRAPPMPAKFVNITVFTDDYPHENSWQVDSALTGQTHTTMGPFRSQRTAYTTELELPYGTYTFTMFDSYRDGLCCRYGNGWYEVSTAGVVIARRNARYRTTQVSAAAAKASSDTAPFKSCS